jgi:Ser/Thr protein kinase RdoA (MazF antagonist)
LVVAAGVAAVTVRQRQIGMLDSWPTLRFSGRIADGERSEVFEADLGGDRVVARRSRRSADSLAWELDVLVQLADHEFNVARPIAAADGRLAVDGWVVQPWIDGRPPSSPDNWLRVADELSRLHSVGPAVTQRPGCCVVTELDAIGRSVDADLTVLPDEVRRLACGVFASVADAPVSLIHGDPGPSNIRIDEHDQVWLLDWDESRIDVSWHDLSNLGVVVLDADTSRRAVLLSHAWETVNAWTVEPDYAKDRLRRLTSMLE